MVQDLMKSSQSVSIQMKPLAEGQNAIYYSSIAYSPEFVTLYVAFLLGIGTCRTTISYSSNFAK